MRLFQALALVSVLLLSSPAFAMMGEEYDSEHQTQQYGHIFGGVLAGVAGLILLIGGYIVFKGMIAEHNRGKKTSVFREEILDKLPKKKPQPLYLGEKVPAWKIDNRQKAIVAALKFLARSDRRFSKKHMMSVVDTAVDSVKEAIEVRSGRAIQHLVTPECLTNLVTDIKKLRKKGELHVYGNVEVTDVDLVHLDAPTSKKDHAFTALVSARSKDYVKDEKTGEVLRGDKKVYIYQEFWCFRRTKERWLVERIRPSGDMDRILNEKNVMAKSELQDFAKEADPEFLREFAAG